MCSEIVGVSFVYPIHDTHIVQHLPMIAVICATLGEKCSRKIAMHTRFVLCSVHATVHCTFHVLMNEVMRNNGTTFIARRFL